MSQSMDDKRRRRVWIESLKIEGGILHGFEQRFSRKLNVLIGARGTGKSSVIELIRYCLGASSNSPGGEQLSTEHALGVLGDGKVTVTLSNGKQRLQISRTAQDTEIEEGELGMTEEDLHELMRKLESPARDQ
jgi:predicted ATP-dependent endonuclease of OLD family